MQQNLHQQQQQQIDWNSCTRTHTKEVEMPKILRPLRPPVQKTGSKINNILQNTMMIIDENARQRK